MRLISICIIIIIIIIITRWYFGDIARAEAEKLLMLSTNHPGTFLVRISSSQKDALSLSLRDSDGIKHYRIRKMDDGGFFITHRAIFNTLLVSVILLQQTKMSYLLIVCVILSPLLNYA